jgi:hypothetical protein
MPRAAQVKSSPSSPPSFCSPALAAFIARLGKTPETTQAVFFCLRHSAQAAIDCLYQEFLQ